MMNIRAQGKIVFRRLLAGPYTLRSVMAKQKLVQLAGGAMLAVGVTGCGGINASKSVSPLDFILPGLIQTAPQPVVPAVTPTNSVCVIAQVRP